MKKQLKNKARIQKRKLEYEFIFTSGKNQKILLQRYAKESVVWWDQGRQKKIWKGDMSVCEAGEFVKEKWPKRCIIYSNAGHNPPPRPTDVPKFAI